jgi:hypothetical protein
MESDVEEKRGEERMFKMVQGFTCGGWLSFPHNELGHT